jgi:hypothetical protein
VECEQQTQHSKVQKEEKRARLRKKTKSQQVLPQQKLDPMQQKFQPTKYKIREQPPVHLR